MIWLGDIDLALLHQEVIGAKSMLLPFEQPHLPFKGHQGSLTTVV